MIITWTIKEYFKHERVIDANRIYDSLPLNIKHIF
jgi:hypothetical protein